MAEKLKAITERSAPGFVEAKLVTLDERIVIDDYDPKHPGVLWYCDNCHTGHNVTAQFMAPHGWLTLCATCLQNALNGIAVSLANPVSFDDPDYGKEPPHA